MAEETFSFDEGLQKLTDIVTQMEKEELSLEDSLNKFEEGMKLVRRCNEELDAAEKKVSVIRGDGSTDEFKESN
ncbi:MAG: exodeoxyribonuclease VII small subunit [Lachnospiraceae bacterium]|nr:exodeoxyribonuclease VII small subunit [Lachnospiraceae bacterium]